MGGTSFLLQAALNGSRSKADHPAVPITTAELVADARACVGAGAGAIHLHPRDADGRETLDSAIVDATVRAVREACGVPVGVSTGAWIERDPERRAELVGAWTAPDYASVNLSEPGAVAVMDALRAAGIGIEAGVWTMEDALRLSKSGHADGLTRILVEMIDEPREAAAALASATQAVLDSLTIDAPRLQHGEGETTWPVLRDAIARGCDTRIGLEDTLVDETGAPADNAWLVRAARAVT
jgi:uncharacterized protein (DUF849 family)